jgi:hypothetical protein
MKKRNAKASPASAPTLPPEALAALAVRVSTIAVADTFNLLVRARFALSVSKL